MRMITEHKIIAIVRGLSKEKIVPTAQALYDGGIRLIEVTFNQSSKTTVEDTANSIKSICEKFGEKICVGAGTVLTIEQVEAAFNAGAKYLISPNTDVNIIAACKRIGLVSIPGALTPSEVMLAYNSGADLVKLFPAGSLGFDYIRAILAPLNHIPMLAVGGIDEQNIKEFIDIGMSGVGVGSNIVKNNLINEGKFDDIKILARRYTQAIQQ